MAEYIEREALLGSIGLTQLHFVAHGDNKSLYDIINEQPASDVYTEEEVRDAYTDGFSEGMAQGMEKAVVHGRWVYCGLLATCSECETSFNALTMTAHYCPNCGAKMDAEA